MGALGEMDGGGEPDEAENEAAEMAEVEGGEQVARGAALARRVEAGTVGVNGYRPDMSSPFGGIKASGSGRENGPEGLAPFLRSDSLYLFAS